MTDTSTGTNSVAQDQLREIAAAIRNGEAQ